MKKVIILGTIHLGFTPKDELIKEIEKYKPDQLLIELTEKEVKEGQENSIRDEMFYVHEFASSSAIPYVLFDTDEDTLKDGITGTEPDFLLMEEKVKQVLVGSDWKELNEAHPWLQKDIKEIEDRIVTTYFDTNRMKMREIKIAQNIRENLIEGTNVVITGCGHITHLLQDLPGSVAPLRTARPD